MKLRFKCRDKFVKELDIKGAPVIWLKLNIGTALSLLLAHKKFKNPQADCEN